MGFKAKVATFLSLLMLILGNVAFLKIGDFSTNSPSDDAKANVAPTDSVIHSYLLAHPEVLREMSQKLAERDEVEQQDRFKEALPEVLGHLTAPDQLAASGNPNGDVTIVEFYDVECPFCKALTPDLDRLVKDDEYTRIVYRPFPILGEMSVTGAKAEIASEKQGLYEKFHAALMADKTPEHQLDQKHLFRLASLVGLDVTRLKRDMQNPEVMKRIEANKAEAAKLAISGTPGLVFLGPKNKENYMFSRSMRYDEMKAKLAELRLAAR